MHGANAAERWRRPLLIALIFAPVLAVYSILYRYALGIPCLDDYNAVLNFLLYERAAYGFRAKLLTALTFQHAEYKLIFEHLLFAAWYALTGSFSFRVFLTLGNGLLLACLWVLWRLHRATERSPGNSLLLFVPVSLLLFELTYAELLNWTMALLSGLAVVAFALCSLYLLLRTPPRHTPMALVFAALACAASGNGFLLAPAGLITLWLCGRLRHALSWLLPFALMLPLYLYHYVRMAADGPATLARQIAFSLSFLGGAVENMHGYPIHHASLVLGVLLLLLFAHAVYTRFWQRAPALFALALWVLLTAELAAAARSHVSVAQSLSVRYKIYSVLLLIIAYLYVLDRLREARAGSWLGRTRRPVLSAIFAAVLLFSIAGDVVGARFLASRRERLVEGMRRFKQDPAHDSPLFAPDDPEDFSESDRESERLVLSEAIRTGIYRIPELPPGRMPQTD